MGAVSTTTRRDRGDTPRFRPDRQHCEHSGWRPLGHRSDSVGRLLGSGRRLDLQAVPEALGDRPWAAAWACCDCPEGAARRGPRRCRVVAPCQPSGHAGPKPSTLMPVGPQRKSRRGDLATRRASALQPVPSAGGRTQASTEAVQRRGGCGSGLPHLARLGRQRSSREPCGFRSDRGRPAPYRASSRRSSKRPRGHGRRRLLLAQGKLLGPLRLATCGPGRRTVGACAPATVVFKKIASDARLSFRDSTDAASLRTVLSRRRAESTRWPRRAMTAAPPSSAVTVIAARRCATTTHLGATVGARSSSRAGATRSCCRGHCVALGREQVGRFLGLLSSVARLVSEAGNVAAGFAVPTAVPERKYRCASYSGRYGSRFSRG